MAAKNVRKEKEIFLSPFFLRFSFPPTPPSPSLFFADARLRQLSIKSNVMSRRLNCKNIFIIDEWFFYFKFEVLKHALFSWFLFSLYYKL